MSLVPGARNGARAIASVAAMKSHTVYHTFETRNRREFVRITEDVAAAVRDSGISEGMVLVSAMHITAGVWINDDEPGIQADALEWLDKLAPPSWQEPANEVARELLPDPGDYRHHRGGEDNGDAHFKNLLVHHQVIVPVTEGQLDLGPWQAIFYCEFDGGAQAARDQGDRRVGVDGSRVFADDALADRVAIVTGGGTNLGKAAAEELARCGATVVIAGRRAEVLQEAAAEIGSRCDTVTGDIREPEQAEQIVATTVERHGRLDFVLNNAGGQYFVPAEGITTKGWRAVQRLNVGGTLAMCEAAYGRAMRSAGRGMIVNVTVSPHHGMPAMAHTGAARAAVESLTEELAGRWRPDGVSVAAIAIGGSRPNRCASTQGAVAKRRRDGPATAPRRCRGIRLACRAARDGNRTGVLRICADDRRWG